MISSIGKGWITPKTHGLNGYLSLSEFVALAGPAGERMGELEPKGFQAFVHTWVKPGENVVVIIAIRQAEMSSNEFMNGVESSSREQENSKTFDVPGIPGAVGYTFSQQVNGVQRTIGLIAFARGTDGFAVETIDLKERPPSVALVAKVARLQAARVPRQAVASPRSSDVSYRVGELVGAFGFPLLLILGIISAVRRRRAKRRGRETPVEPAPPAIDEPEMNATEIVVEQPLVAERSGSATEVAPVSVPLRAPRKAPSVSRGARKPPPSKVTASARNKKDASGATASADTKGIAARTVSKSVHKVTGTPRKASARASGTSAGSRRPPAKSAGKPRTPRAPRAPL